MFVLKIVLFWCSALLFSHINCLLCLWNTNSLVFKVRRDCWCQRSQVLPLLLAMSRTRNKPRGKDSAMFWRKEICISTAETWWGSTATTSFTSRIASVTHSGTLLRRRKDAKIKWKHSWIVSLSFGNLWNINLHILLDALMEPTACCLHICSSWL